MYTTTKKEKQPFILQYCKGLELAKSILSDDQLSNAPNCATIGIQLCESEKMSNELLSPVEALQVLQNFELAREAFARLATRLENKIYDEDNQLELISKAATYNIPFKSDSNFLELSNKIDEYEFLLCEAKQYGIDWDISEYDLIALQQEIDYYERQELEERNVMYLDYISSRAIQI